MSKLTSVLSDTWRGLVARRLWPVAAVLLVALVAVPVLLTSEPEPVAPASAPVDVATELAAQPLVAVASPAERERSRRVLGARKDPFKPTNQPKRKRSRSASSSGAQSPNGAGAAAGPGSATSGGGSTPGSGGSSYLAPSPQPAATATPAPKAPRPAPGTLTVRWGAVGEAEPEAVSLERLEPLEGGEEPMLVYLGLTGDRRSAVFMLDAGATVDGDGHCRPSREECETFTLAPGETAFIETGAEEAGATTQFQLDLVRIHGRRGSRVARKDAAVEARATSRVLRSLGRAAPAYRFDARTGTLKAISPGR